MEEVIQIKKTFVTLEKVHAVIVKEFIKNIIVTTIYKEFKSSKKTESQYTQTQEMEIDWIYVNDDWSNYGRCF